MANTYNDTDWSTDGNTKGSATSSTVDNVALGGTLSVTGASTLSSTLAVTGIISPTTHIDMPDSANIKLGTGDDLQLYHDGSNSYVTNSTGALKLATESSGIAVTIGHTTSEVTIGDNLTINGDLTFNTSGGRDILFGDNLGAALEFKEGSNLYMRFVSTNGSEAINLNKSLAATNATFSGNIGIGTTNPLSQLHLASATDEKPVILIEKTGSANHDGGNIQFRLKEDSGFIDNGKEIGDLQWYSYDSTDEDYNASAMIRVTASGTQAQNRAGGEMTFWTNNDDTVTSKKMTIDSAGVVTLTSYMVEGRTLIKIPATAFIANDDQLNGYQFAILEDDGSNFGTRVGGAGAELFAYVDVPLGYTATKVKITGSDTANEVEVYTLDLDDGTIGSEISNSGLTVADDTDLDSNHVGADDKMLLIKVATAATDDIVYGGYVTIQAT